MALRTEADLLRTLEGTFSVEELARLVAAAGLSERDGGLDRIQDGARRYKHRVRGALQTLKRRGLAERVGAATWVIQGTRIRPERAVLVLLSHQPGEVELVLGDAAEILRRAEEPIDLIVADPPWGLGRQVRGDSRRDRGERLYERNHDQVIGGYVEVDGDPGAYSEFTARWVEAAARALKPRGGYLAVVTGPQRTACVQVAAEAAGLTFMNRVVVHKPFALRTTRRFAFAHSEITILVSGRVDDPRRFFACPTDLPRARSGVDYPTDWWGDVKKHERRGLLRYDNQLAPRLVGRLVEGLTPGDWQALVADPFLGGGTTALVCNRSRRRFYGGDVNPEALRFTMAQVLEEVLALGREPELALLSA